MSKTITATTWELIFGNSVQIIEKVSDFGTICYFTPQSLCAERAGLLVLSSWYRHPKSPRISTFLIQMITITNKINNSQSATYGHLRHLDYRLTNIILPKAMTLHGPVPGHRSRPNDATLCRSVWCVCMSVYMQLDSLGEPFRWKLRLRMKWTVLPLWVHTNVHDWTHPP